MRMKTKKVVVGTNNLLSFVPSSSYSWDFLYLFRRRLVSVVNFVR